MFERSTKKVLTKPTEKFFYSLNSKLPCVKDCEISSAGESSFQVVPVQDIPEVFQNFGSNYSIIDEHFRLTFYV